MAKRPQWMAGIVYPDDDARNTVKRAAQLLMEDAKAHRKAGRKDAAAALQDAAVSLVKVSYKEPWDKAFALPGAAHA